MPEQVQFGIVGGGYWTERYLMVCRELPERFRISGMVVCAPFHPQPPQPARGGHAVIRRAAAQA